MFSRVQLNTTTIYLGRAFSSVVPLITLLFLNAQDKFDLSYQLALTLLISQISFGLLNFGWSIDVLRTQNFNSSEKLKVFTILILWVLALLLFELFNNFSYLSFINLTVLGVFFLYLELYFRALKKNIFSLFFLSKFFILFLIFGESIFNIFSSILIFIVSFIILRIRKHNEIKKFHYKDRKLFWVITNTNYLTQNSDQIIIALIFSELLPIYAVIVRALRIFDPLLFAYNQIKAVDYGQINNRKKLTRIKYKQQIINFLFCSCGILFGAIIIYLGYENLQFEYFIIFSMAAYVFMRLPAGGSFILNYHNQVRFLLKIEIITLILMSAALYFGNYYHFNINILFGIFFLSQFIRFLFIEIKVRECLA